MVFDKTSFRDKGSPTTKLSSCDIVCAIRTILNANGIESTENGDLASENEEPLVSITLFQAMSPELGIQINQIFRPAGVVIATDGHGEKNMLVSGGGRRAPGRSTDHQV